MVSCRVLTSNDEQPATAAVYVRTAHQPPFAIVAHTLRGAKGDSEAIQEDEKTCNPALRATIGSCAEPWNIAPSLLVASHLSPVPRRQIRVVKAKLTIGQGVQVSARGE